MATNHGVGGSNPSSPTTGQKGKAFPFRGRKIMIGIADPKLWNLGVGLLSKWNGLTFSFFNFKTLMEDILNIVFLHQHILLFYAP